MKQAIYLFTFLAFPFLLQAKTLVNHGLNGVWKSEFSNHIYQIKEVPNGLEVNYRGNKWVFFERISRNKFANHHGSYLLVTGARSLKHRNHHGGIIRRLYWAKPLEIHTPPPPPPVCVTPHPEVHYDTHTHYETTSYDHIVEGTWWMQNRDERLYIQRTREGLRAKSEVRDQWYYYRKIAPNKYVDDRGNEYKIADEKTVIWTHTNGREALVFVK